MRIQNNITAMNTHRMYTINNNAVSKSAEKLSSGYRINRAGDDAAGLAISEKMRSQIRGLNMASKNSQDAVSLIQTAEGALQEVHSMLQRMNELANQAGTGTNETFDRQQIDAEFNQLKSEIDQIAETTSFNNMKLLDGSLASDAAKVAVSSSSTLMNAKSLTSAAGTNPNYTVTNHTGLSSQEGAYTIADNSDETITITFTDAKNGNVTNTTIDLKKAVTGDVANGKSFTVDLSEAGLGTYTLTADNTGTANISDLAAALATGTVNTSVGTGTVDATATDSTAVHGAISFDFDSDAIKEAVSTAFGGDSGESYSLSLKADGSDVGLYAMSSDGTEKKIGTATMAALTQSTAKTFDIVTSDGSKLGVINVAASTADVPANIADITEIRDAILGGATATKELGSVVTGSGGKGGLKIQVGANEGEQLTISVAAMSAKGLNISNSSISDQTKAGNAITATQKAINLVSEQRATLGAMQNRLEHKIANLDNTSENLSAAESRIRDVDIAKEMTNFTKSNILSQAATAMLAQANAAPQGVLSLLQ